MTVFEVIGFHGYYSSDKTHVLIYTLGKDAKIRYFNECIITESHVYVFLN